MQRIQDSVAAHLSVSLRACQEEFEREPGIDPHHVQLIQ